MVTVVAKAANLACCPYRAKVHELKATNDRGRYKSGRSDVKNFRNVVQIRILIDHTLTTNLIQKLS